GTRVSVAADCSLDPEIAVHVPLRLAPRGDEAFDRHDVTRDTALHVGRATPVDAAILDLGRPGVVAPSFSAADRDDVGMSVQEQRAPSARALQDRNDVRPSLVASVDRYLWGMFLQLLPVRFPHVDVEAELLHVVGKKLLDPGFVPGDAGDGNHVLEKGDGLLPTGIDLLENLFAGARTHSRSSKIPVSGEPFG